MSKNKKKTVVVKQRIYNPTFTEQGNADVVLWDIFPLGQSKMVEVTFESTSSAMKQGLRLSTDEGIKIDGEIFPGVKLWYHNSPSTVVCECMSSDGLLSVYNVWEDELGRCFSQSWSSGMLVEDLPRGRRYSCNDFGLDTSFDKLVFRIETLDG